MKNKWEEVLAKFFDRLTSLLKVKSLLTIILVVLFYNLAMLGAIEPKDVVTIFLMVVSFYFGTQSKKE